MNRIKPVKNRVLVEPIVEKQSKVGSIHIPDSAQDKSTEGTVVSLPDKGTSADELKIGDRVFFARFGGTDVKQNGRMFKLLDQNEIFAVIEHS